MARTKQTARRPGFPYKKPAATWSTLPQLASRPRPAFGDVGSAVTNSNNVRASSNTGSRDSDKASKGKLNQQEEIKNNPDKSGDSNHDGSNENNNDLLPDPSGMDVDDTMVEENIEPQPNENNDDVDDDLPELEGMEDGGDVGILAESGTNNNDDNVEDDDDEEEEPTTRFDVYQTLKRVAFPGSIASSGYADDILPSLPGLTIGGCPVSLPLTDAAAKTLLKRSSVAWPVRDPTYRNTYQISADKIAFGNPSWGDGMDDLLDTVCIRLGMERSRITAKLDMMFIMEAGAKVEKRKDENATAADEVLGTLLVQLPSVFTGGSIRIRHEYEYIREEDEAHEEDSENDDDNEDVVDEGTLIRAVDLIYIAGEDEATLTAKDIIRSLERDHAFQLNQDRKDLVEERLSDLIAGDVLPQIESRSGSGSNSSSGNQPSRGLLLRAVNLLYFATCTDGTGSFGVNEVCQSIQDAHQISLDQGSKEIITNQVAGILAGTMLPTLDDDFSDVSVAMSANGGGGEEEEEEEKDIREEKMQFTLGAGDDSAFGCRFMCYYGGCDFSMKQILTGRRIMLAYSLCHDDDDNEVEEEEKTKKKTKEADKKSLKPNATLVCSSMVPLQRSLALLPRADRIFLRPLSFNYDSVSLSNHGIEALEGDDRKIAQGLKVAVGKDWKLFIVEAKMVHNRTIGYYGSTTKSEYLPGELLKIFDKDGDEMEDETEDWISSILDFASCEVDDNGAILCREMGDAFDPGTGCDCGMCGPKFVPKDYTIEDVWGEGDCVTSECGYHDITKKKTTYSSHFLLAYDESSEFELMALGGHIAMENAVDDVVCSWDASLLKRLVETMQLKGPKCALPLSSCRTLLSTILGEDEDSEEDHLVLDEKDMMSFVPTVLRNLCSEDEPDEDLYKLVLSAIEKLGWHNLVEPIATMMNKKSKLQTLKLPQFLSRVEFIFKAEAISSCSTDELRTFLDLSCYDFSLSPNYKRHPRTAIKLKRVDTSAICEKLEGWVKDRGWELMQGVAQVTISACANIDEQQNNDYQEESTGLMKRCEALLRLYSANPSGRHEITKLLCDATSDIVRKIERPGKILKNGTGPLSDEDILASKEWMHMLLTRLLFRFGSQTIFDRFGKCLVKEEGALLTVLKYLDEDQTMLHPIQRDILNRCLVQHSVEGIWKKEAIDEFRSSSLHIRRILSFRPRIACEKDDEGRIPLHWSTDCDDPKLDNVTDIFNSNTKAVAVVDPITGLFPFMLAAKQGCADAAFMLLREDPSLVSGGMPQETKKRKRSEDMEPSSDEA